MRCRRSSTAAPTTTSTRCCEWLPALHAEGLVDAVDAFCERIGFTRGADRSGCSRPRARSACRSSCMPSSSATAAARRSRRATARSSCDHLEYLSEAGVQAMARAGTVAVLLPGAFYFLRETRLPPIERLRDAGVPMAVATDHNPGSSPGSSLLLMLNMACTLFRLTPEEALRGVTRARRARAGPAATAARSKPACAPTSSLWDVEQAERSWPTAFGRNPCRRVVRAGGRPCYERRLSLHRGTHAAAGERAARRARACRPSSAALRRARARGRRHRLAPRSRCTTSCTALGAVVDRAALLPLS